MTNADLTSRALSRLDGGPARLDPLTLLILSAVIGTVIAHFTEKLLERCEAKSIRNPGFLARRKLRKVVSAAWGDPAVRKDAPPDFDPGAWDRLHGDDVRDALLAVASGLSDAEIRGVLGR